MLNDFFWPEVAVSKISAAKRKQSGSTSAVVGGNKTPQAPVAAEQPVPAADKVSDVNVTEHVKTALHQSDLLKTFDIAVVTLKGDVRLIGVLDSQAQIDEAIKIARATDGTHAIHAELTLKK